MRDDSSRRFSRPQHECEPLTAISEPRLSRHSRHDAPTSASKAPDGPRRDGPPQRLGVPSTTVRQEERGSTATSRRRERAGRDHAPDGERTAENHPDGHVGEHVPDRSLREGVQPEQRLRQGVLEEPSDRPREDCTAEAAGTRDDRGRDQQPVDRPGPTIGRSPEEELESRRPGQDQGDPPEAHRRALDPSASSRAGKGARTSTSVRREKDAAGATRISRKRFPPRETDWTRPIGMPRG